MSILSKKYRFKRYSLSYVKLFVFIFAMDIFFCPKNQQNVLQKVKVWTHEVYLLTRPLSILLSVYWFIVLLSIFIHFIIYLWTGDPVLDYGWLSHSKCLVSDLMPGSSIFCQTVRVWIVFFSPKSCPKSLKYMWPAKS